MTKLEEIRKRLVWYKDELDQGPSPLMPEWIYVEDIQTLLAELDRAEAELKRLREAGQRHYDYNRGHLINNKLPHEIDDEFYAVLDGIKPRVKGD